MQMKELIDTKFGTFLYQRIYSHGKEGF